MEIKALLDKILKEQVNMRKAFDGRFERLESRIGTIETRQDEIYHVVKAIEHSNQVARAEIDTLQVKAAKTEGTFEAIM